MTHEENASVLSDDIEELEKEIVEIEAQRDEVIKEIRRLMDTEDFQAGVFHHEEIHKAQQKKLVLEFDLDFRRKKINRLTLGVDENIQ